MFIILTLAKIKEPEGNYPISIQNSKYGSKLLINQNIVEIQEYKNSLDSNPLNESYSQRLSQMSPCSQVSSQDKFLHKADVMSLSKVNGLMQDGELDPMAFIESIDDIFGLTLAFKIKVQPSYNRSSALMMSPDAQLNGSILNQISPDEEACIRDKGKSVCSVMKEDGLFDSQSSSATTDYDPEQLGSVTPAKRATSDMQFDEIPTQDLASTQLSSTKTAKHIKME